MAKASDGPPSSSDVFNKLQQPALMVMQGEMKRSPLIGEPDQVDEATPYFTIAKASALKNIKAAAFEVDGGKSQQTLNEENSEHIRRFERIVCKEVTEDSKLLSYLSVGDRTCQAAAAQMGGPYMEEAHGPAKEMHINSITVDNEETVGPTEE